MIRTHPNEVAALAVARLAGVDAAVPGQRAVDHQLVVSLHLHPASKYFLHIEIFFSE